MNREIHASAALSLEIISGEGSPSSRSMKIWVESPYWIGRSGSDGIWTLVFHAVAWYLTDWAIAIIVLKLCEVTFAHGVNMVAPLSVLPPCRPLYDKITWPVSNRTGSTVKITVSSQRGQASYYLIALRWRRCVSPCVTCLSMNRPQQRGDSGCLPYSGWVTFGGFLYFAVSREELSLN
jgi:hypothetical protein